MNVEVWKQFTIPDHRGSRHLLTQAYEAGVYIEDWALALLATRSPGFIIRPRLHRVNFYVGRVSNKILGLTQQRIPLVQSKTKMYSKGLQDLSLEEILAMSLDSGLASPTWTRLLMKTFVDRDASHLELVLVR